MSSRREIEAVAEYNDIRETSCGPVPGPPIEEAVWLPIIGPHVILCVWSPGSVIVSTACLSLRCFVAFSF